MRALIEPEGLRNSHLAKMPSSSSSRGVSCTASRMLLDTRVYRTGMFDSFNGIAVSKHAPKHAILPDEVVHQGHHGMADHHGQQQPRKRRVQHAAERRQPRDPGALRHQSNAENGQAVAVA